MTGEQKNRIDVINIKGFGRFNNLEEFFEKIGDVHGGKWVAVKRDGTVVAHSDLQALYDASGQPSDVLILFRAPLKGQKYFLRGVEAPQPPWASLTGRQKVARVLDYFVYY